MKKQSQNRKVINYYLNHAKQYPRFLGGALLSLPITILVNNYLPAIILADVLSKLSQHDFTSDIWQSFGPQVIAYATLLFVGIILWRINDYFMWTLEAKVQRAIAQQVYVHLLNETADFHANNFSGSLVSQTNKVIGGYVRTADTTNYQVLPLITGLFAAAIILAPRAPIYVALLITFSIAFLALSFKLSKPTQKLAAKHANYESVQTGVLADSITNIMTIKSFARSAFEKQRFSRITTKTHDSLIALGNQMIKQFNILNSIARTMTTLALFVAIFSVVVFKSDIGTVFLIFSYTSDIVERLFAFSNNSLRSYNRSFGDASDMVNILEAEPSIKDPEQPEPLAVKRGSIAFKNTTFTHDGAEDALFDDFNLEVKHGEKIGLVGHSGSGKTTFTRLLLRFSDIGSGSIEIDGQNIANVTQDDLHSVIAYVPQEPLLFHRTIKENIAYGKPDATDEEIAIAAKRSHAAEFIETLPKGYETLVGERGVKLSGGQRQRIAIARAMLKNAPILLLDEATSALDSESEVLIQDALWKLMEGRTAIVIAHRLSTIQKMDRIVVLEEGKIVEQGTHTELLENKGTYASFWAHQSGGFMEE